MDDPRKAYVKEIATRFSVTYDVRRALTSADGRGTPGYEVALIGRCDGLAAGGSARGEAMWIDLGILAHAALPRSDWRTRFVVRPFDPRFSRSGSQEVELIIDLRHNAGYAASDSREDIDLGRLIANLKALGVGPTSDRAPSG